MKLNHKFVTTIPNTIDDGIIYISMEYATAIHKCCCGCGNKVVTPFSTSDWNLSFDGESISLSPSIGNWSFPCQSHYWITKNEVIWAEKWSKEEIEAVRDYDQRNNEIRHSNKPEYPSIISLIAKYFSRKK